MSEQRSVSVHVEKCNTGEILAASEDMTPYSRLRVSDHVLGSNYTKATVSFSEIQDHQIFVQFIYSDDDIDIGLINNNTTSVNVNFNRKLDISTVNILTENELDRVSRIYGFDNAFKKNGLHNELDDKVLQI